MSRNFLHDSRVQAEGVFSLLDVLFGGAASIVEAGDLVRLHWQVGDDEAHAGEPRTSTRGIGNIGRRVEFINFMNKF